MNLDVCINIYITPAYSQMAGEEESDDGTSTASGCRLQSGLTRFNCRTAQALTKEMAAIKPGRAIGPRCPHFVQPFTFSDTYLWLFFLSPSSQYPLPPRPPLYLQPQPHFQWLPFSADCIIQEQSLPQFHAGPSCGDSGTADDDNLHIQAHPSWLVWGWRWSEGGGNGNLILVYVCSVADTYL